MGTAAKPYAETNRTLYNILFAISLAHLFNDTIQAVIPAIFPILRDSLQFKLPPAGPGGLCPQHIKIRLLALAYKYGSSLAVQFHLWANPDEVSSARFSWPFSVPFSVLP